MKKRAILYLCFFALIYLGLFSFQKIDLSSADIGRHLTNGDIFLHPDAFNATRTAILNTNFFSYTNASFPFINHHWASGVLLYLVFTVCGFGGLSLLYFLWIAGALIFIILSITDEVDWHTWSLTSIFFIPVIANRLEIRPEGLSILFLAIAFYILFRYSRDRLSWRWLYVLPAIQLLWVNMHIYFIFGIYLIGIYVFETIVLKQWQKTKYLSGALVLSVLVSFMNPYGWKAVIYPFLIFNNYGYRIVENQSIPFLENLSIANPTFLWFKIIFCLLVVTSVWMFVRSRRNFLITPTIMALTFAVLGYLSIRSIAVFGLFAFPLITYNIYHIRKLFKVNMTEEIRIITYVLLYVIILGATMLQFGNQLVWNRDAGLGLADDALGSVDFVKAHDLHGPIFNNYDVGGLLIYSLYPREKVFVDNRPEAYPKKFFSDVYVAMQEKDEIWKTELEKEKFNMIFFYRLDYTPWAQAFLIRRVGDASWAPVYVDARTIILLRRVPENARIISKYEIPKSAFGMH